jgi:hypothetical protein
VFDVAEAGCVLERFDQEPAGTFRAGHHIRSRSHENACKPSSAAFVGWNPIQV